MRNWIRQNWVIYLPMVGIVFFIAAFFVVIVLQSRYSEIGVADQKLVSGKVIIDKAFLTSDGFVAIHPSDAQGNLVRSSSIGHSPLESGLSFKVGIRLSQPVASGTKLFAVVHRDTGAAQRYEFSRTAPEKDPIELVRGEPVASAFSVN